MKYLFILAVLALLLNLASASITNTTDFYNTETKENLYYQSYAGY